VSFAPSSSNSQRFQAPTGPPPALLRRSPAEEGLSSNIPPPLLILAFFFEGSSRHWALSSAFPCPPALAGLFPSAFVELPHLFTTPLFFLRDRDFPTDDFFLPKEEPPCLDDPVRAVFPRSSFPPFKPVLADRRRAIDFLPIDPFFLSVSVPRTEKAAAPALTSLFPRANCRVPLSPTFWGIC